MMETMDQEVLVVQQEMQVNKDNPDKQELTDQEVLVVLEELQV
jgi:hypothetical protein